MQTTKIWFKIMDTARTGKILTVPKDQWGVLIMDTAGTGEILTVLKGQWGVPMQTVMQGVVDDAATVLLVRYRRKLMAPKVLKARVGLFCSRRQLPRAARTAHPVCRQSQAAVESQPNTEGTRSQTQGQLRLLHQAVSSTFIQPTPW
jgi:hypothetical protein